MDKLSRLIASTAVSSDGSGPLHHHHHHHHISASDLQSIIDEARDIESRYGHYFDMILTVTDIDRAYAELLREINALERDAQWIPISWIKWIKTKCQLLFMPLFALILTEAIKECLKTLWTSICHTHSFSSIILIRDSSSSSTKTSFTIIHSIINKHLNMKKEKQSQTSLFLQQHPFLLLMMTMMVTFNWNRCKLLDIYSSNFHVCPPLESFLWLKYCYTSLWSRNNLILKKANKLTNKRQSKELNQDDKKTNTNECLPEDLICISRLRNNSSQVQE